MRANKAALVITLVCYQVFPTQTAFAQSINTEPASCTASGCITLIPNFQGGLGQTFTALGSTLSSFSWFAGYPTPPAGIFMEALVMGFDPGTTKLTGDVLFRTSITGGGVMAERTYTPNIVVTPGQMYAAFLYVAGPPKVFSPSMRQVEDSPYTTGSMFYVTGGTSSPSAVDLQNAKVQLYDLLVPNKYDLAFSATFTSDVVSTPEPSTWLLMATGLCVVVGAGLKGHMHV